MSTFPQRQPEERPEGEDHRDGPPGYDLDEQTAMRELMARQERDRAVQARAADAPPD
jgi:hypothetical protein